MHTQSKKDILGGLTTFLTMAYIVVVNPSVIAQPGTGMSFAGVMTATVLLAFTMTLLMGLYAKLPFAVAPGLGVNAFFTYTIVLGKGVAWPIALGAVFWAGVLFLLCSVFNIREKIVMAIPQNIREALAVGLGLFLAFIGLKNMGVVAPDPDTFVKLGEINLEVILALLAMILTAFLLMRGWNSAYLLTIVISTIVAKLLGQVEWPEQFFSMPDFKSVFMAFEPWQALKLSLLPTIISIFFTDMFDSLSTFVGVAKATDMENSEGEPKNLKQGLIVDALATLFAGVFGTSSGTAYMESAVGIKAGGKTGLSAIVTALCFLPCFFIAPMVAIIPGYVSGAILVLVGMAMFQSVKDMNFARYEEAIPNFMVILLIPLTFSITHGILWGFISHTILFVLAGRQKEVSLTMYILAMISMALIVMEQMGV
ncbi:NCS2 family permease [bacterium]|nr:NCS2 family permease [bacterium]